MAGFVNYWKDQSSVSKVPRGELHHQCSYPGTHNTLTSNLPSCTGCLAVRYCSKKHQKLHRNDHKTDCNKIKQLRTKLSALEAKLRNAKPNVFHTSVGHFGTLERTRDYLTARMVLAHELQSAGTLDGTREALRHIEDVMRLDEKDTLCVRLYAPSSMLQVDEDQKCFDFVQWWVRAAHPGGYDGTYHDAIRAQPGDPYAKPLDVYRHFDDIQGVAVLLAQFGLGAGSSRLWGLPVLVPMVYMLILKLKLLADIQNVKVARKVLGCKVLGRTKKGPRKIYASLEGSVIRSPLSKRLPEWSRGVKALSQIESELAVQVRHIGTNIAKKNKYLIDMVYNPMEADQCMAENQYAARQGNTAGVIPTPAKGSRLEAAMTFKYTEQAWWGTEEALEIMNAMRMISLDKLTDASGERVVKGELTPLQATGWVIKASNDQMWDNVELALKEVAFLGPVSERPSQQHGRLPFGSAMANAGVDGREGCNVM